MPDEIRDRYADVDGVRLHWAELGEGTRHPPLVLLHGLTDSYLSWRPVAAELARDRLVLMPDLPGCGLSGRPNVSYKLEWQAHMIARWLELRGLATVDFVGHSYGGGVAQMLLLVCPQRIRRLVLVAPGGLGRGVGFWLKLATFPKAVECWGQPFMAFGTRRALGGGRHPSAREDMAALSIMNSERGTARAFSRMVRDVIDWRGQTRYFLQRAMEIRAFPPIAVFWGERDSLIPASHGRAFVEVMAGAVFRPFPGCGHYLHQEDSKEFVEATLAFLDDPHVPPARLLASSKAPRSRLDLGEAALRRAAPRLSRVGLVRPAPLVRKVLGAINRRFELHSRARSERSPSDQ
jgi:pimeloyl-ACP methyl ester carboxylesterase